MKKLSVISLFTVSLMVACAAPVKTSTQRNTKTYVFGTPEGFSVTSLSATSVAISFDYNGAVDGGYNVYYGDSTELKGVEGLIPSPIKTLANSITIGNVPEGVKTYFAVSALKADGTESDKTTIISIIPVALPGNQVQKTVHAQLEICVDQLDKIKFEGGKMILSDHADGSAFPGKADNCDIAGARLHTDESVKTVDEHGDTVIQHIKRVIPAVGEAAWAPDVVGRSLDLTIYNIVTTKPMIISGLDPMTPHCVGLGFNKTEVKSENDDAGVQNTISIDASECDTDNGLNFIDGDRGIIDFDLNYTATE